METNQRNIYQRLIEVQKKVTSVDKNEKVSTGSERSYKAVSHDDVAALLHLPLAEAGIVLVPTVLKYNFSEFEIDKKTYLQKWYRTDIEILVKWVNADKPDDFVESMGAAYAIDTSDKSFSKAYSLALKIVLLKFHLLESRDNEEERLLERENKAPQKQEPRPAPTPIKNNKPTQDQLKRMFTIGNANGWKTELIKKHILDNFKIESSKDLEIHQYEKLCDYMQKFPIKADGVPSEGKSEVDPKIEPPPIPTLPQASVDIPKPTDPRDYVLESPNEFFNDLHGKPLREIRESDLRALLNWLNDAVKQNPPPKGMFKLLETQSKILKFFIQLGR